MDAVALLLMLAAVVLVLAAFGRLNRKEFHAPIWADIGLVVVIATGVFVSIVISAAEVTVCALSGIGAYALGHLFGPPERAVRLWLHDSKTHKNHIMTVKHYEANKTKYLAPKVFGDTLAALFGVRDKLEIDLSRPYYTTSLRIDDDDEFGNIIPVAYAEDPVVSYVRRLRFGSKKVSNPEDPEGPRIKKPRYLLKVKQCTLKFVLAERMYQRPDIILFDADALSKAIVDASAARAQVTRLEQENKTAKYEGVVDHVRDMCSLDVDRPNLPDDLREIVKAEEDRRLAKASEAGSNG